MGASMAIAVCMAPRFTQKAKEALDPLLKRAHREHGSEAATALWWTVMHHIAKARIDVWDPTVSEHSAWGDWAEDWLQGWFDDDFDDLDESMPDYAHEVEDRYERLVRIQLTGWADSVWCGPNRYVTELYIPYGKGKIRVWAASGGSTWGDEPTNEYKMLGVFDYLELWNKSIRFPEVIRALQAKAEEDERKLYSPEPVSSPGDGL